MKILLAADGSEYTRKAAAYLANHLSMLKEKPEVFVHNVHPALPYASAIAAVGRKAVETYQQEEAEKALEVASAEMKKVDCRVSWSVGDAAEELQKFVKKHKIDLVVMGSRGMSPLKNLALGSVANKLVSTLDVPVLIVR